MQYASHMVVGYGYMSFREYNLCRISNMNDILVMIYMRVYIYIMNFGMSSIRYMNDTAYMSTESKEVANRRMRVHTCAYTSHRTYLEAQLNDYVLHKTIPRRTVDRWLAAASPGVAAGNGVAGIV